jgi:hypothetical protein
LRDFKSMLEGIRGIIPGANKDKSVIGTRAIEGGVAGALIGGAYGAFGGPFGAIGGGIIGGVGGVAAGYLEQQAAANKEKWKAEERERSSAIAQVIRGFPAGPGGIFPGGTSAAPAPNITLNLNVDGRALGQAISESGVPYNGFPTQAPAADGTGQFYGGDHNHLDK